MLSDLIRDLRYALRMLAAAPTFTAVVVITLALGVGANALIFTAVDAILLRSPGLADPGRLVSVYNAGTNGQTGQTIFSTLSFPDYADVRDSGIFHDAAAYGGISVSLDSGAETEVDCRRARDRQLLSGPGRRAGLRPRLRRRRGSSRHARARRGRLVCLLAEPARRLAVGDRPRDQSERIALRRHRGRAAPLRGGEARSSAGRLAADGASTGSASALGRAAAFARQRRSSQCAGAALAQHRGQGQTGDHRGPAHRGARRAGAASAGRPILRPTGTAPSTRLRSAKDRACGPRPGPCSTCSRWRSRWCC